MLLQIARETKTFSRSHSISIAIAFRVRHLNLVRVLLFGVRYKLKGHTRKRIFDSGGEKHVPPNEMVRT